jgi:hypothetical protein
MSRQPLPALPLPTTKGFLNLIDKKFGRLTVGSYAGRLKGEGHWNCRCECGNEVVIMGYLLRKGATQSCGCIKKELLSARSKTHGASSGGKWTPEYRAWVSLKTRCKYVHRKDFKWYGSRGITVCSEWQTDFLAFFNEIGPRPSPKHSVDRINNDRGYEPGNVRWATASQQRRNTRSMSGLARGVPHLSRSVTQA